MQAKLNFNKMVMTAPIDPRSVSEKSSARNRSGRKGTKRSSFKASVSPVELLDSIHVFSAFTSMPARPRTVWARFGVAMTVVLTAASSIVVFAASLSAGLGGIY